MIAGRLSIVAQVEDRKVLSPLEWPKLREGRERSKVRKTELFVFHISLQVAIRAKSHG